MGSCRTGKDSPKCPYCDKQIAEASFPYCAACEVKLPSCPKCHRAVSADMKVCPSCGTKIKG